MPEKQFKVLRLKIIKPVSMDWDALGKVLRDTRYRVFRLANLAASEAYLAFHLFRTGRIDAIPRATISELNKRLRHMLTEDARARAGKPPKNSARTFKEPTAAETEALMNTFSKTGALPDTVAGALYMYRIRGLTSGEKWKQVVTGNASLPTFRNTMAVPIRADKTHQRRLERLGNGDVVLDLMLRNKPYPRVLVGTRGIGEGAEAVVERLLANQSQAEAGYRQRYFEVREDASHTWWLFVCYTLPAPAPLKLDVSRIVGVDVGFTCPVYAAIGHGHARLGYKAFSALAARVKALKLHTLRTRREVQRGGNVAVSAESARSGRGIKRKLQPIEKLEGRIDDAYTTLNHQMAAAVVKFAIDNGAGMIQVEDLGGLRDKLSGTFLGQMWRYYQLHTFIQYKAEEHGIKFRKVSPQYTSRRCSLCGRIDAAFTRKARDEKAGDGYAARFECPTCQFKADADYNAARNLAVDGIEGIIRKQCNEQGILFRTDEAAGTQC
jgi:IS605 OrfB family transposase